MALDELYRRHAPLLLAFLLARAPRAEAEDIHQAAWLRVWKKLPGAGPGPFRGWLYQVARRHLIDHHRKKHPSPLGEAEFDALPDARGETPDAGLIEGERAAALRDCLAKLSEAARDVVRDRLAGESTGSIASKRGIATEQVSRIYYKTREALKSCLERALP